MAASCCRPSSRQGARRQYAGWRSVKSRSGRALQSLQRGPEQFLAFGHELRKLRDVPMIDTLWDEMPLAVILIAGLNPCFKRLVALFKIFAGGKKLQIPDAIDAIQNLFDPVFRNVHGHQQPFLGM